MVDLLPYRYNVFNPVILWSKEDASSCEGCVTKGLKPL